MLKYKTVETRTLKGLRQAERLKANGWKITGNGLFTIRFEKKVSPKKPCRDALKIRKNGMEGLYMNSRGEWVAWESAPWFRDQYKAAAFAESHGVKVFGLFSQKAVGD